MDEESVNNEQLSLHFCVGFVFLSTSKEIGWEERIQNDLFCVEWDVFN